MRWSDKGARQIETKGIGSYSATPNFAVRVVVKYLPEGLRPQAISLQGNPLAPVSTIRYGKCDAK